MIKKFGNLIINTDYIVAIFPPYKNKQDNTWNIQIYISFNAGNNQDLPYILLTGDKDTTETTYQEMTQWVNKTNKKG